ncbi:hypothetical protein [Paracidobacterium acidisoli]|uniref:Serine protease n=1 Tax=Paracidobacterium acidisoli TaxID=2303751 RepID=A0A372IQ46_9BACT|nr:hypothetical protein [Paracidobacterium acidisoli]MBT9331448.1 S1 family peptidase [Paracidobacterium acidisoli]
MLVFAKARLLAAPLVLAMAGCGTMSFAPQANDGAFSISASATSVNTNGQIAFHATLPSGEPAAVKWAVTGGQNSAVLGEGKIDASGIYTPPNALSLDEAAVQVRAVLAGNPASSAVETVMVHPGFVQPLLPQNAALTPGSALEVTGQIAEVSGGRVEWSLSTSGAGGGEENPLLGTLSGETCQRNAQRYTTCRVTYLAPVAVQAGAVYLIASVNGSPATAPLKILLDDKGVNSSPSANQAIQTGAIALGSSGSNDNDYDTWQDRNGDPYIADCCGGTLGALVADAQGNQYILSNNHVLAESDQAKAGDPIDQPGLIDGACVPLSAAGATVHPVGTLKFYVPLASTQTNVDAAVASVAPGAVDPAGSILQLGGPGADEALTAAPPMAGHGEALTAANLNTLQVAKSGRTTGLTCSTVDSVDLTVKVDYYRDCAETEPYYTKTYVNQIGIAGDHFTDSGDSGALVLDAANAQPVGLYFAGGSDGKGNGISIANPIGDVLDELSSRGGSAFSVVGTTAAHEVACLKYDTAAGETAGPEVSDGARERAQFVAETLAAPLVNNEKGILATATGKSLDAPGEGAVIVYVDAAKLKTAEPQTAIPETVGGIRTQVIATDALSLARGVEPAAPAVEAGIHLTAAALTHAGVVERQYASALMSDPAIFGVGVTQSEDDASQAALLVLADVNQSPRVMPATLGGLRVRYMRLHRFHVTRSKYAEPNAVSSCALKGLEATRQSRAERSASEWRVPAELGH